MAAAILQGIRDGLAGTMSGVSAAWQKFSKNITDSTYWHSASEVATPYFQQIKSNYPEQMKFNLFSKDFAAGAITLIAIGAMINKVRG